LIDPSKTAETGGEDSGRMLTHNGRAADIDDNGITAREISTRRRAN